MTRDELLDRGDETVTIRQIVERFETVEEEYSGMPWTLKQIYQQIDMLVSEKPCGDCISRETVVNKLDYLCDCLCDYSKKQRSSMCGTCKLGSVFDALDDLPSVTPAPKMGHWIKCIDDNGSSYYLCSSCRCGEDFKFDFCPNCGSDNREVGE